MPWTLLLWRTAVFRGYAANCRDKRITQKDELAKEKSDLDVGITNIWISQNILCWILHVDVALAVAFCIQDEVARLSEGNKALKEELQELKHKYEMLLKYAK